MTSKQWHRYFIRKSAQFIKENGIEGVFVECGVKQGTCSAIMAEVLQREGFLFDTWIGFPHFSSVDAFTDKRKKQLEKRVHNRKSTYEDCVDNLRNKKVLNYCHMIRGDICETVPDFSLLNKKISMIHIDTDLYEPAKISLSYLWKNVVPGGIVFFHDYGDKKWPGIKKLVDTFVRENSVSFYIFDSEKLFSCYLVKEFKDIKSYLKYIQ